LDEWLVKELSVLRRRSIQRRYPGHRGFPRFLMALEFRDSYATLYLIRIEGRAEYPVSLKKLMSVTSA